MTKAAKKASKDKTKPKKEPKEEQGYTPEDLARAERLLRAVTEALPQIDNILKTANEWRKREGSSSDWDREPPPLMRQSASYRDAVDPATFEQFSTLIDFLRMSVFGVDCDNDPAVRFVLQDRGREEDFLPSFRVPRVKDRASLSKRFEQLELAKMNLQCMKSTVDRMEKSFERDLTAVVLLDDLLQKAKDCTVCKGKGWVETDRDTWFALDYGARCRTADIGCDYTAKPEDEYYKTFRLFCECQNESEDDGDSGDDN
jgi:hypothetical protein